MADYHINLKALLEYKSDLEGRDKQIPLTEVATETGLSYLTIQKLYHDGSAWSRTTMTRLCEYFGMEPGNLLIRVE